MLLELFKNDQKRLYANLFILSVTTIALIVLYYLNPMDYLLMPKCPFKLITGLSCGGCGGQRAVYAFIHGQFNEAIGYNYYLIFAVPYLIMLYVAHWIIPLNMKEKTLAILEHRYVIYCYIITYFIWMIIRNILKI